MVSVMVRNPTQAEEYTQGSYIASGRKKLGLSQKELANKIIKLEDGNAISPQYLNDLERDRRQLTSDHLIKQFAKVLELNADYLNYLAGQFPAEALRKKLSQEDFQLAYAAFRRS